MSAAGTVAPSAPVAMERMILDFLAYLELERGLSRNTLEAYRSDLLQFGEFLDRRGLAVTNASHGDIAAFLSGLGDGSGGRPPVGASTLPRQVARPRSFLQPPRPENAIAHDPT